MSELEVELSSTERQHYAPKSSAPSKGPSGLSQAILEIDEQLKAEVAKIPDKMAFKIGEVAKLSGVKSYILRYWEKEFSILSPKKSKNNQRMFSKKDVEHVLLIKKLLYRDRFSIEGAKAALKSLKQDLKKTTAVDKASADFEQAKDDIHEILLELRQLKMLLRGET